VSSLVEVLERMHVADMHLVCACMNKVPEAIPALERHYLAELPAQLKLPSSWRMKSASACASS
jgi:hypothetical protein